ncbi:hypothetical protein [Vibrio stylophorae]|uniref:hypothetical protein n=1 Tax=Vibrio stylophorae TaxID=659351 RepID=UPI001F224206|nr:hypothetical protein [Vibrio stylophorae]
MSDKLAGVITRKSTARNFTGKKPNAFDANAAKKKRRCKSFDEKYGCKKRTR